jgi:hypothetical protein
MTCKSLAADISAPSHDLALRKDDQKKLKITENLAQPFTGLRAWLLIQPPGQYTDCGVSLHVDAVDAADAVSDESVPRG